jgi:hypothetical protein
LQANKTPLRHSPLKQHTAKIDQEASKRKGQEANCVELYFESLFFKPLEPENEIAIKTG